MRIPSYYPGACNPLHEVNDWRKVRSMMRAMRRGESLPPVYCDAYPDGNWISGTHRVSAAEILCQLDGGEITDYVDVYEASKDVFKKLSDDEIYEFWMFEPEDQTRILDGYYFGDDMEEERIEAIRRILQEGF